MSEVSRPWENKRAGSQKGGNKRNVMDFNSSRKGRAGAPRYLLIILY